MGLFSSGSKVLDRSPTEKVEQALGVFQEAKKNLQDLHSEFEAEKAILEDQLKEVSLQGDRISLTLTKLKDLCG